MNYHTIAKRVISEEASALSDLVNNIPADFEKTVNYIINLRGRVILLGMGKSGHIARKIASSFASTGTPAFFIHPSEASHGDLGMITDTDLVIMLSNSGETKELFDTINYCKRFNVTIVGITMKELSTLAQNSNFALIIPENKEASLISAPTTSALMMLALGDAMVTSVHEARGFSKNDFLVFHPGGKIGANLLKVHDIMYKGNKLPIVRANDNLSQIILTITEKKLGCTVVTNSEMQILGIITDGDLRRNMINGIISNRSVAQEIMTPTPFTIHESNLATEALYLMNSKSITVLPVENNNCVIGLLHIHDILRAGVG